MVTFVKRHDIADGTYLRQTSNQFGSPEGLIAVVCHVGTSWTGEWHFQLRSLNRPVGAQTKAVSHWSVHLREEDLVHFELVGTWLPAEVLQKSSSPSGKKHTNKRGLRAWKRGKVHLHQLRMFEDF
jgi:hypothetical protein